ncbi:MAG: hypothetical protein R3287_09155 [Anderseniella sp.]|nr:hypothetical protein [Anderseniella sp.]
MGPAWAASKQGGGAFTRKAKPKRQKSNKPASKRKAKPRSTTAKPLSGYVRVSVRVPSTKPDGRRWDVDGKNNRQAPDIFITDTSTGRKSRVCENSFSCSIQIRNARGSISLKVTDKDIMQHDTIGRGRCSLASRNCSLERVRARLSGC